jgi:hypothetical protein
MNEEDQAIRTIKFDRVNAMKFDRVNKSGE